MTALILVANPRVKFSSDQLSAINGEVLRYYCRFVCLGCGLTLAGLVRSYDDGAGDVIRDFDALSLRLPSSPAIVEPASSTIVDRLEQLIIKHVDDGLDEDFDKEICALRSRADDAKGRREAFDSHMAMGHVVYERRLFDDAIVSFRRASELQPANPHPRLNAGRSLYFVGQHAEAQVELQRALVAAEVGSAKHAHALPEIHVGLAMAMEQEGMLVRACRHYREAAVLCPDNDQMHMTLGCALLAIGDDIATALQEFRTAVGLNADNVEALYHLGGCLMDEGRWEWASDIYALVVSLRDCHWKAKLNLAVALMAQGRGEDEKNSTRK